MMETLKVCLGADIIQQAAEKAAKEKEKADAEKRAKAKKLKEEFAEANKQWEDDKKGMDGLASKEQPGQQKQLVDAKVGDSAQQPPPAEEKAAGQGDQVVAQKDAADG